MYWPDSQELATPEVNNDMDILWMVSIDLLVEVVVEADLDVVQVLREESDVNLLANFEDPAINLA